MVTLYGHDTPSIIKVLSDTLEGPKSSPPELAKKKRAKKGYLIELYRVAHHKSDDSEHSAHIISWLGSRTPESREALSSLHNPLVASFVKQMYTKKLVEGEFDFALIDDPKILEEGRLDEIFYFRRKNLDSISPTNSKFSAEKRVEQLLKLTDTEEYLDTLTCDKELIKDFDQLLDLMNQVSGNKAFQVPCRAFWESYLKKWLWEYPPWMNPSKFNTLAAWACASIERAFWTNYWQMKEPHKLTEGSLPEEPEVPFYLNQKKQLGEFLSKISQNKQKEIVGNADDLGRTFQSIKQDLSKLSQTQINTWFYPYFRFPMLNTLESSVLMCYGAQIASLYSSNSTRNIQHFQSTKSVESILDKLKNESPENFIEFLACSSLERSVTIFDILARKVLQKIKSAYTEKNAQDLLQICEAENKPKSSKKPKKKKKDRNSSPESVRSESTNSSTKASQDEEDQLVLAEKKVVSEIVKDIISKVIETVKPKPYKVCDLKVTDLETINEAEFQIVNKKKFKKPPRNNKRPQNRNRNKRQRKNNKKQTKAPPKKEKPPQLEIHWETNTGVSKTSTNQVEFPPLLASSNSFDRTDTLHQEIIQFGNQVLSSMSAKKPIIEAFKSRLREVVWSLFPESDLEVYGSYGSGLALEFSDIDVAITNTNLFSRDLIQMACLQLATILENCGWVLNVSCIATAAVPVIKLQFHSFYCSGLGNEIIMADVTFDDSNEFQTGTHLGIPSLMKTCELINERPQVQYLALVLKKFLYANQLNSAYKGGLSSYSLTLWIVACLNQMGTPTENLGELLLEFLDVFGKRFDPTCTGVSVANKG